MISSLDTCVAEGAGPAGSTTTLELVEQVKTDPAVLTGAAQALKHLWAQAKTCTLNNK